MKRSISILIFLLINSLVFGQAKEVSIHLNHKYNGANFNFDSTYVVDGNTPIKFNRLEYYLHIKSLISNDGETTNLSDNYLLVNPNQNQYNIGVHNVENINSIEFHLGVDPDINDANPNDPSLWENSHPLANQIPSMHWGWSAGYIFLALEAMIDKQEDGILESPLTFHIVDGPYYSSINLSNLSSELTGIIETENTVTFHMDVNYEKILYNVNVSNGGIFMGLYDENTEIVNNISSNNVFTIPENLNLKETYISNAVFPNPFSNTIQLNLNENSIVKVYNSLGILVDEYKLDKGQQQINTQTLLNGVYILSIQSKSGTENIKLLKN